MRLFFRYTFRFLAIFLECIYAILFIGAFYFAYSLVLTIPPAKDKAILHQERTTINDSTFVLNHSWSRKTKDAYYEIYLTGAPFERGVAYGKLLKEPIQRQEDHFIASISKLVPSARYRYFLMLLIGFVNRNLDEYIPVEYQSEIYGVSFSFSDKYDYLRSKYSRILNYHAAHDIGHALNDYSMVGCTSFAVQDEYTADSSIIIGRNFDFYMGDDFAKEKVLTIMKPYKGYGYVSYSWAGFMGVVSGMNEKGLTVTINASKSKIPTVSKVPISILTREILQYASTTQEAIAIAKKRDVFVSETIMVGCAKEHKTILIEKAPDKMDVYESNKHWLVCSNHYQGEDFFNTDINQQNMKGSDSKYRYDRMKELLFDNFPISPLKTAEILRNKNGLNDKFLGYGNAQSINQLIAHHGVIFEPEKGLMWISTNPFQLGRFVCYDLNKIFEKPYLSVNEKITIDSMDIASDSFLDSDNYKKFIKWKEIKQHLFDDYMLGIKYPFSKEKTTEFIALNPENYNSYMTLGEYYKAHKQYSTAISYFKIALTKHPSSLNETKSIENLIHECNKLIAKN